MTRLQELVNWILWGDVHKFYVSPEWRRKRKEILAKDKSECQICKNKYKRYRKATTVHHVKEIKQSPYLCLSEYFTDRNGVQQRNLLSVCQMCHETECHPERRRKWEKKKLLTEEKW